MAYKWRPSKSQRKAFAIRMQNPEEQAEYQARKEVKSEKRRAGSSFDYQTAGGNYRPTQFQHDSAFRLLFTDLSDLSIEQQEACNQVILCFDISEPCFHDYIHIVNELIRHNQF